MPIIGGKKNKPMLEIETDMEPKRDWKKMVTLNPPNLVKFKIHDQAGVEPKATKGIAFLEIINKSTDVILFKVKTTNINSYLVRPNAEIIEPDNSLNVRIETNHFIGVSNRLFFIFTTKFITGQQKIMSR